MFSLFDKDNAGHKRDPKDEHTLKFKVNSSENVPWTRQKEVTLSGDGYKLGPNLKLSVDKIITTEIIDIKQVKAWDNDRVWLIMWSMQVPKEKMHR